MESNDLANYDRSLTTLYKTVLNTTVTGLAEQHSTVAKTTWLPAGYYKIKLTLSGSMGDFCVYALSQENKGYRNIIGAIVTTEDAPQLPTGSIIENTQYPLVGNVSFSENKDTMYLYLPTTMCIIFAISDSGSSCSKIEIYI